MTEPMTSERHVASMPDGTSQAVGEAKPRSLELGRRVVSSSMLLIVVLGTLFALPLWVYALVVISFGTAALYEFFTMVRRRGILVHRPLAIGLGIVFMALVAWRSLLVQTTAPRLGEGATMLNWAWDIFWPATIVIIFLRQFTRENTFEALSGLATTIFGLAYIAGLFSYVFYIRAFKHEQGVLLILFLILVTKMGDVGAFAFGKTMGRHTLVARISPRKTVEGFVGGALVSAATGALCVGMVGRFHGSPLIGFAVGLGLGVFAQLGDLAESLIKRDCQVKDSAQLLPGIGGVLDVIDSLLFTAPLFYGVLIYG